MKPEFEKLWDFVSDSTHVEVRKESLEKQTKLGRSHEQARLCYRVRGLPAYLTLPQSCLLAIPQSKGFSTSWDDLAGSSRTKMWRSLHSAWALSGCFN